MFHYWLSEQLHTPLSLLLDTLTSAEIEGYRKYFEAKEREREREKLVRGATQVFS